VRADGRKELIALTDGYRESAESWADLLRDCARRGMSAPVLAVGDGALGFWGALREVFADTREQRCWFHKSANVLSALPKSAWLTPWLPGSAPNGAIWARDSRQAVDRSKSRSAGVRRSVADYSCTWQHRHFMGGVGLNVRGGIPSTCVMRPCRCMVAHSGRARLPDRAWCCRTSVER
jgi:mutator family transposase